MKDMLTILLQPQEAFAALVQGKNPWAALLYAYGQTTSGVIDPHKVIQSMEITPTELKRATDSLLAFGICKKTKEFTPKGPGVDADELLHLTQTDYGFQGICRVYENAKGAYLVQTEIEMLYDIYANLGISPDMVTLLIGLLKDLGKFSRFNVQKTAYEWNDAAISTYEAAEEYMNAKHVKGNNYRDLLRALGILGRGPVPSEKKYLDDWISKGISVDLITYGYEKTVFNLKELKWPYINKILESWHKAGYTNRADVDAGETKSLYGHSGGTGAKSGKKSKAAILTEQYDVERHQREEAATTLLQKLMGQNASFAENQRKTTALSQKVALSALMGTDIEILKQQSQELAAQRKVILRNLGITEEMISPKPNCEKCNDHGYIGSEMCECFKKRLETM